MPTDKKVHSIIYNNDKSETPKCLTLGKGLYTNYGVVKKYFQIIYNDMKNAK